MSSTTRTQTARSENPHTKKKNQDLKEATCTKDEDTAINNVKTLDNVCTFTKCKNKTTLIGIDCKFCKGRFCTTHGLPEIHGCGEAVRREEKREYHHPEPKLSNEKHEQAQTKLNMKLRQMQQERKSKQGFQSKGKKK
ncbi:DNA-binding protein SMUBP-2 [Anthonomus grandis grandis]|uniref:DNA-binding protein SMUBP-2 n=1 Tax=Anthonomus grandis grandis TaxID=2921223 RepID=UPI0021660AFE|nr:DNA-binding protein SMUBP-2 [Anthonomus grandis grandis]